MYEINRDSYLKINKGKKNFLLILGRRYISQKEGKQHVFNYLCGTTLNSKEGWSCDGGADGVDTAERKTKSTKLKDKTKQF